MTPKQIELVQSSFAKVAPISAKAAELFYGRLFEIAPQVKPLFRGPLDEQGRKLMATLGFVVGGLDDVAAVVPAAEMLALRHVKYGVAPDHYAAVGETLIWTLRQGLGGDFTSEVEAAWAAAYALLSQAMIAAAYPKQDAAE